MKTVIDKKTYNTETATLIAEWNNEMCRNDLQAEEALYRTKKGQYFVCGSGGELTTYDGSTEIRLMSPEEAYDWCKTCEINANIIKANFEIEEG